MKPSEIVKEAVNYIPKPRTIFEVQEAQINALIHYLDQLHETIGDLKDTKNKDLEMIEVIKRNKITVEDLEFLMELKSMFISNIGLYTDFRGIKSGKIYSLLSSDFKTIHKVFK